MSTDQEIGAADAQEYELAWEEACRREDAIRDLLRRYPQRLTVALVDEVAGQLGLSQASLYRLIRLFRTHGTVTALMPRAKGRPQGLHLLDAKREALIRQVLNEF